MFRRKEVERTRCGLEIELDRLGAGELKIEFEEIDPGQGLALECLTVSSRKDLRQHLKTSNRARSAVWRREGGEVKIHISASPPDCTLGTKVMG